LKELSNGKKSSGFGEITIAGRPGNAITARRSRSRPHGVNIMEFCKAFNEKTKSQEGTVIPALITIFSDRTFSFVTKTPPATFLIKKAAKLAKGAHAPKKEVAGSIAKSSIKEIAQLKMVDLNAKNLEGACGSLKGLQEVWVLK
jgi:large subunit ribosomal protein L11